MRGVDLSPILAGDGPAAALLQDPDGRMSREVAWRLLDRAVVVSGDDALGVHAAEQIRAGDFDALELVVRASRSRREALNAVQRYIGLMIDGVSMVNTVGGPMEAWSFVFPATASRVTVEFAYGAILVVGSRLADGNQRPYELEFAYPEPLARAEFERVFDCPVRWNSARTALLMTTDRLDRKIANITPSLTEAVKHHAEKLLAERETAATFSARVREHIIDALRAGAATPEDVCSHMKISERTLRRKLQDEGNTFSSLLGEVRREFASRHLNDPDVSITEAAFLLGFSDSRAFQRAFRKWYGVSPSEYRRKARDAT
jgi:AraC-like DNA-binding protein